MAEFEQCCVINGTPAAVDLLPPKGVLEFRHGEYACRNQDYWWLKRLSELASWPIEVKR